MHFRRLPTKMQLFKALEAILWPRVGTVASERNTFQIPLHLFGDSSSGIALHSIALLTEGEGSIESSEVASE